MTLDEITRSTKEMLSPADIAKVLGADPYGINRMARDNPRALGFAVMVIGNRVKIPRRAFLHWLCYGNAPITREEREEARG